MTNSKGIFRGSILSAFFLMLVCEKVIPLSSDKDEQIELSSNTAIRNEKDGFTKYSGEVVLKQGSLKIIADTLYVFHSSGRATKMIATGLPVKLQQTPSIGKSEITATAKEMHYERDKNLVTLKWNAEISQSNSKIQGDKITYSISKQEVVAESSEENKTGRVNMILPSDMLGNEL